ncbi:MAG: type II toxin-antitoxin system MqsA family antitoxin, partial [Spirochaetes bacterium]|nr:type II toxin-antitoxin system MqsA family antitoxin [Spirochaetota bacterium]
MRCALCKHGETKEGTVTVTLERSGSIIIIKNVPADVCDNCGEYYLSKDITSKVLKQAEEAIKKGIEVEILKFAA